MSEFNYPSSQQASQPIIAEIVSVGVELRLQSQADDSKVKAFADVTLHMRPGGSLTIHGCLVVQENGRAPVVLPPSRKGDRRYFPHVSLSGEIRRVAEETVLAEFDRQTRVAE